MLPYQLARMAGRVDVDEFMDEIPDALYQRWQVVNRVSPIDHVEKMLGLIATQLTQLNGGKAPRNADGSYLFMPWVPVEDE